MPAVYDFTTLIANVTFLTVVFTVMLSTFIVSITF